VIVVVYTLYLDRGDAQLRAHEWCDPTSRLAFLTRLHGRLFMTYGVAVCGLIALADKSKRGITSITTVVAIIAVLCVVLFLGHKDVRSGADVRTHTTSATPFLEPPTRDASSSLWAISEGGVFVRANARDDATCRRFIAERINSFHAPELLPFSARAWRHFVDECSAQGKCAARRRTRWHDCSECATGWTGRDCTALVNATRAETVEYTALTANQRACDGRRLLRWTAPRSGFGSNVYTLIWALRAAAGVDRLLVWGPSWTRGSDCDDLTPDDSDWRCFYRPLHDCHIEPSLYADELCAAFNASTASRNEAGLVCLNRTTIRARFGSMRGDALNTVLG
jgi:hypothetical protein